METFFGSLPNYNERIYHASAQLLNAADICFLPKTVNNLLHIMTTSNDVYKMALKPFNYYLSVLFLNNYMQTSYK